MDNKKTIRTSMWVGGILLGSWAFYEIFLKPKEKPKSTDEKLAEIEESVVDYSVSNITQGIELIKDIISEIKGKNTIKISKEQADAMLKTLDMSKSVKLPKDKAQVIAQARKILQNNGYLVRRPIDPLKPKKQILKSSPYAKTS